MMNMPIQGLHTALQGDPQARLAEIYDRQRANPGRLPGGTGLTGLQSNDSQGWSDMLNEQTEAGNLENQLAGKAPMTVKRGNPGSFGGGLGDDLNWWAKGLGQMGQGTSMQSFPAAFHPALLGLQAR